MDTRGNKVVFDCGKRNCSWKVHSQMCAMSKNVFPPLDQTQKTLAKLETGNFLKLKPQIQTPYTNTILIDLWRWLFVLLLLLFCFVLIFFLFFFFEPTPSGCCCGDGDVTKPRTSLDDGRPRSSCGSVSWHRGVWQQPQAACPAFKGSWRRLPERWRELPNYSVSTAAEPAHFTKHGGGIEKRIAQDCQFFFINQKVY